MSEASKRKKPAIERQISGLIEEYAEWLEANGRSPATSKSYSEKLRYWPRYLRKRGISNLSDITPQDASGFQTWLYGYRTQYGRSMTIKTQWSILQTLQGFCRYLLKSGHVPSDPTETIKLPILPKKVPTSILSSKEMKKLLNQPDASTVLGFRDRTLLEVLYSTGLRISELIGLRMQDFDAAVSTLFIHKGKGEKDRILPLGKTACLYLEEYLHKARPILLHRHKPESKAFQRTANNESEEETIFLSRFGRPFTETGLTEKIKLYVVRAGIKKPVTVHTFRHSLATGMLKRGANLRQIQEILGHAKLKSTEIYTHIVKGELKRIQAKCHPREQTELPDAAFKYRGRTYFTEKEKEKEQKL